MGIKYVAGAIPGKNVKTKNTESERGKVKDRRNTKRGEKPDNLISNEKAGKICFVLTK
jgi:hypothetical protein